MSAATIADDSTEVSISNGDNHNTEIIDSLPAYSDVLAEERISRYPLPRHRSGSLEHILGCSNDDIEQNGKICCTNYGCKVCLASCLTFRRLLTLLTSLGILSFTAGVVLGGTRLPHHGYVSLSIMFSVLGLLLLVVALIGWRCTPTDNEPCHLLFGLGSYSMVQQRQFVRGHHRRANRFHWIGGRLFPEFRYRRPPPTYIASMQERQHSLNQLVARGVIPQTPPPTYKLYSSRRTRARTRQFDNTNSIVESCPTPPAYESHNVVVERLTHEEEHSNHTSNEQSTTATLEVVSPINNLASVGCNSKDDSKTGVVRTVNRQDEAKPDIPANTSRDFCEMLGEVTHL
ncbi:hypothetical protein EB796_022464 [Bugula neritina]|uniref:Uncharacterized protein n=1 Tax=Bugula neritina TaxID=10212 RepID=A0A7J7IZ77_BUGNE|nr:hypothetical protein EB796_022464 [Bugula neritina]